MRYCQVFAVDIVDTGGQIRFEMQTKALFHALCASAVLAFVSAEMRVAADTVVLTNATATFSQGAFNGLPPYLVDKAIDGIIDSNNGWAAYPQVGGIPQTAVFQTVSDVGYVDGTTFKFEIIQNTFTGHHGLGRFRLSVTQDPRNTFANHLQTNGSVAANWVALVPDSVVSSGGATMDVLQDDSVLVSGVNPFTDTYTIKASTLLTNITGIRLEALPHASLPFGGPGRGENANFSVGEFKVSAVPTIAPIVKIAVTELQIRFDTRTNRLYQLQSSPSLFDGWTNIGGVLTGTGEDIVITDRDLSGGIKNYRVQIVP